LQAVQFDICRLGLLGRASGFAPEASVTSRSQLSLQFPLWNKLNPILIVLFVFFLTTSIEDIFLQELDRPLVYPNMEFVHGAMGCFSNLCKFFHHS
jgi:hypothetical protein